MSKWTPAMEAELADTCLPAQSIVGIRTDLVAAALHEIRRLREELSKFQEEVRDSAYRAGFDAGFLDGVKDGRGDGRVEGARAMQENAARVVRTLISGDRPVEISNWLAKACQQINGLIPEDV